MNGGEPDEQAYLRSLRLVAVKIEETGRTVMLAVPADLSAAELLAVISWMSTPAGLRAVLATTQPSSSLVLPQRPTIVRPLA